MKLSLRQALSLRSLTRVLLKEEAFDRYIGSATTIDGSSSGATATGKSENGIEVEHFRLFRRSQMDVVGP
jgi:hypothetical protein